MKGSWGLLSHASYTIVLRDCAGCGRLRGHPRGDTEREAVTGGCRDGLAHVRGCGKPFGNLSLNGCQRSSTESTWRSYRYLYYDVVGLWLL